MVDNALWRDAMARDRHGPLTAPSDLASISVKFDIIRLFPLIKPDFIQS